MNQPDGLNVNEFLFRRIKLRLRFRIRYIIDTGLGSSVVNIFHFHWLNQCVTEYNFNRYYCLVNRKSLFFG